MRRLQLFARVFFKAAVLLLAVKVSYTQTCQPCQYKTSTVKTTQISVQVTADATCHVYNTTFNQMGSTITISDLIPGTTYLLTINCTTECCSNFTTQAVTPTVTHVNTTSVTISWTPLPFANTSVTTRPQGVSNLTASMVTTESVNLTWVKGEGKSPFFRVLWNDVQNKLNGSKSTSDVSAMVAGLIPGTKHEFMVKSVAADNHTEGEVSQTLSVLTKPGIPENITAEQRGNNSMTVSWRKPKGNVQQYVVLLGNQNQTVQSPGTSVAFSSLKPGTVYICKVFSVLESQNSSSGPVELATKPNPPDSVNVINPTTNSLTLTWSTPLQMNESTNLSYEVSYSSVGSAAAVVTVNGTKNVTLRSLVSGTQYSLNVSTIGPQDLRSSIVSLDKYTLPNPVTNLTSTTLNTSSLRLEWGNPLGYQSYYSYKVQVMEVSNDTAYSQTLSGNSANIPGLAPGEIYNCIVTTTILDDVQGQSVYILGYTKPTHVINLKAEALNTTYVTLTWSNPTDYKSSYSYEAEVVGVTGQSKSTNDKSISFGNLDPGTNYTFRVITKVNNQTSQPSEVSSYTKVGKAMGLTAVGTTTTMTVTWVSPSGKVEMYFITIHQDQTLIQNVTESGKTEVVFQNLLPGKSYAVTVTTKSGQFEEQSDTIKNATYPNPPRELKVEQYTNSSISLKWERPQNMSEGNYNYTVTYGDTPTTLTILNNNITLNNLTSGTKYNFTVKTVGAMHYNSLAVTGSQYTNPNPVSDLEQFSCSTRDITVKWTQSDAKTGYAYQVNVTSLHGTLVKQLTVNTTTATIDMLQSGVVYRVIVTTLSAGGTTAPAQSITAFTKPNPITNLVAISENESAVFLNWTRPIDFPLNGSYYITTNCSKVQPNRTVQVETIYISGLEPGVTCFSTVYSQVNNITGDPVSIEYSTRPPKVSPEVMHVGTNGTIYVTWVPVSGVEKYIVSLATAGGPTQTVNISNQESTNHNLSYTFSDLPPATVYTVTITTVSGAFSELSDAVTIATYPTKPGAITIIDKTTHSIALVWGSAPNMTHASFNYTVTYKTTGTNSSEITTANTTLILSGLSSGTTYNISVATVGPMDLKSEPVFMYSVTTKPESVTSLMVSATHTSNITVQWTPPVDFKGGYKYNVSSSNGESHVIEKNEFTFTNLVAGSNYNFSVQTLTADNTAGAVKNVMGYTDPTKPGAITITDKTTQSIALVWGSAPNMTHASFNYIVTYETTGTNSSEITTANTTLILSGLSSGTTYNISVATVGPMDLKSEPVFMYSVTTKPESVTSLMLSATHTSNITVQWTPPADFKGGYKYNVSSSNGESHVIEKNKFTFTSLVAGSNYNFSVQTLTADNTAGAVKNVMGCTVASEVSVLNCVGPNKTEAKLNLTWDNPSGSNTGFEIWLGDSKESISKCNPTCHHDFSGLDYYKNYTVSIVTKGCGQSSSVKSVSCMTGVTDPPKTTTEGSVEVVDIQYNKFTLQLSPSLFNNINGPIVGYGILLTLETASINDGSATNYITKTYSDWTAGKTTTYLAAVQQFQSGAFRAKRSTDPITVVLGDETMWQKYVNGPLRAKGSYSYAVVIFTKLKVESEFISTTQSYFSITAFHNIPVNLPENPAVVGGAIGGGFAVVVIILIVIMIVVAKRKKTEEDSPGVPIHSIRNKVSEPIKVEDYEAHYRRQRADSFCGFAEEFEDLKPVGIAQAKSYALAPENRAKNRYNNVLPYDNSRVRLSVLGSPFDDYINASNMPGYNSRKEFIAAQGPLACTVNDFWRMIWEKNVHTVVMLTRCNEQGRVKCEEYWPAETKHYGNLVVTTTSEIPLEDWTIRDFDVKNVRTAETRAVRHFHFTAWPDHGVPETTELLINFRHLVREHMDQYSRHSPTVVHCSAGVGRTGTFIAIDRLIFQIERDGVVDIYGIIHDLRMHRTLMVQTEDQYVFLNQCAIDIIRSRTGTNVDLIYQNTAALTIYENFEPMKKSKNGYHKA